MNRSRVQGELYILRQAANLKCHSLYNIGQSFQFDEPYPEIAADENPESPSALTLSGHTPSRCRNPSASLSPYPMYPYQREWPFHSRQPLSELSNSNYSGGGASTFGNQVESLLKSQKEIMKAQENLVSMVKGISERAEDLEKAVTSKKGEEDTKLPPALSVRKEIHFMGHFLMYFASEIGSNNP